VLAPLIMGFDPNVSILFSGIGTLIFFAHRWWPSGRAISGSSFSFIGVVIAAPPMRGSGPNANLGGALGGIIAAGALLRGDRPWSVIYSGTGWVEKLMPPVVKWCRGRSDRALP